MKRLALILATTLACGVTSNAQLQLKSGDVFVCQFTTLGNPGNSFGPPARGQFACYGTLPPASELRYEIFENNTADPVLCSGSFSEPRTNVYLGGCQSLGAWQDFQGVVRLTMLKGTAEIKYLYFGAGIPTGTSFRSYEAYVFLPSPTYTLTVSNSGLGSVSPSGSIFGGGDPAMVLTATPSNDWEFVNWSGDA